MQACTTRWSTAHPSLRAASKKKLHNGSEERQKGNNAEIDKHKKKGGTMKRNEGAEEGERRSGKEGQ